LSGESAFKTHGMRIGLISDIHGNDVALEAVAASLSEEDVDELYCLGDVAVGGPQPSATVTRLCELGCHLIRGNADEWLSTGLPREPATSDNEALSQIISWARGQLSASDRAMLADAPLTRELDLCHGYRALLCHGSPRANTDMIVATTSRDLLEPMLAGADADLVVGGHTHRQLFRRHGRMPLVNAGSVGLPLDADDPALGDGVASWAEYCVISVTAGGFEASLRRVKVPHERVIGAASASAMPHADEWQQLLARRLTRPPTRGPGTAEREDLRLIR
jgi:putative phosphoesterase